MNELVGQIQSKLPGKLLHHVMVNGICIALYDVEGVSTFDRRRNVMAFDSNANMIWQIDPPAYIDDFINYYNGLAVEEGQVILTSIGAEKTLLAVNPKTGRVSRADGRPVLIEDDRPEK